MKLRSLTILCVLVLSALLSACGGQSKPKIERSPLVPSHGRVVSVCDPSQGPVSFSGAPGKVKALRPPTITSRNCRHVFHLVSAPTVGEVLSTTNGTWSGSPTSFTYVWEDCNTSGANCSVIGGATSSTYTVGTGDVGSTIVVLVTACNGGGCAVQKSNASGVVTGAAVPVHTENWAYDDCGNGGVGATSALVRLWVNYTEANCGPGGDSKALTDCHSGSTIFCNVVQYLDTNWIFYVSPNQSPQWTSWNASAAETWYLHNPGSTTTRIGQAGYGGGYLQNQNSAGAQSFYQSYVRTNYPNEDGLFMDDQSPGLSIQLFYSNTCATTCATTNEIATDSALRSEHAAMAAALTRTGGATTYPQHGNTIGDCGNANLPQGVGPTNMIVGATVNLIAEGCPESNGTMTTKYAGLLDDGAWIENNTSGSMTFLSYGISGAGTQVQSRLVQEATELIGYKAGQWIAWSNLETGGGGPLAVWPESGIYPTGPLQTMGNPSGTGCFAITGVYCPTGGHNDVQTPTAGVYRREFTTCYNQGTSFGKCAAVVNTTGAPVTVSGSWLTGPFTHSITLVGGDVQASGTINLTGAAFTAGTTTVAANSALILTP